MARGAPEADAGGMHSTPPRNRLRIAVAPTITMRTVNVLLAFAAALCILAGIAGTIAR
jgi:hypothetical protein